MTSAETSSRNSRQPIELEVEGDVTGNWDADRLAEALSNLAGNAIEYATPGTAVTVGRAPTERRSSSRSATRESRFPPTSFRSSSSHFAARKPQEKSATGNLGLGLYIAKQIVSRMAARSTRAPLAARPRLRYGYRAVCTLDARRAVAVSARADCRRDSDREAGHRRCAMTVASSEETPKLVDDEQVDGVHRRCSRLGRTRPCSFSVAAG